MARHRLLILLPGSHLYGQEQALISVARILREESIHCHFLIHGGWGGEIKAYLNNLALSWTELPLGTIWSVSLAKKEPNLILGNIRAVFRTSLILYHTIREKEPTHIIMGNATFASYLLPALFLSKIKIVYRHGDEAAQHSILHRFLNRILFRRVDLHVFNCLYLQSKLEKYTFSKPVKVIYNLPLRTLSHVYCNASGEPKESFRLLFVGQLSEHKGILVLFDAFRSLIKRYPRLQLEIVGDIPGVGHARPVKIASDLQSMLDDYPSQIFHSPFQTDLDAIYRRADLHICPSIWQEPSANVVFEAKCYAIPSVVFRVGGMEELISHQEDGYFCGGLSSDALATGIEYFLENKKFLEDAGYMARKNVNKIFGLKRFRQQWLNVLDATVS